MTKPPILIKDLNKTYKNGFSALKNINLEIKKGEIFALLGPNGAGKTTLIGSICGTVTPTSGRIEIFGYDHKDDFRQARSKVGYVPQELYTDVFETTWATVQFSRGLFNKAPDNDYLAELLQRLSLWDKRHEKITNLSGGMKRRVLIAKALSHQPEILFLDEPTAGVDVELRKSMWQQVEELRQLGVTIILTTHYIEEAEKMSDRIAIINEGQILLTENTQDLIKKMADKEVIIEMETPLKELPKNLVKYKEIIQLSGNSLSFRPGDLPKGTSIFTFFDTLKEDKITPIDFNVRMRNLEEIFINLLEKK